MRIIEVFLPFVKGFFNIFLNFLKKKKSGPAAELPVRTETQKMTEMLSPAGA